MAPTTNHMDREAPEAFLTLDPVEIDRLTWQPVTGCPGVDEKELWRLGVFVDALIRYQPGSSTPGHPHIGAQHHIWVISGAATIAGRRVVAGSYVHIPAAVEHRIGDVGEEGCLLLQMHRPHQPRPAS